MVAGESSGDSLGAGLIRALKSKHPNLKVEGIGGPLMAKEGCKILYPAEKLSVMGLIEVLGAYRELRKIRQSLILSFLDNPPDLFIGIDAPDFNLGLESKLKRNNIKTLHYVSPQVWAWRQYRISKIAKAVDKILVLFPFEKEFYQQHNIAVDYVGHPVADSINISNDISGAREKLALERSGQIIAIMPGSRKMEQSMLSTAFLETCQWCHERNNKLHFITSLLSKKDAEQFRGQIEREYPNLPINVYQNQTTDVLGACDVALLASGTITLEAMLHKKPMVVAYRLKPLTYMILKYLVKVPYVALPNLLANALVVPECLQQDCQPEKMGPLLLEWLESKEKTEHMKKKFTDIHYTLKMNADSVAAESVLSLLE
jgi:lipid-A-disaccharide synthase